MSSAILAATIAAAAACGSSSDGPTEPSGPPSPPTSFTLTGHVVGTVTGEPIAGATVTLPGLVAVTDANGAFTLSDSVADVREVVVTADGTLSRTARLSLFTRDVTIDVIQNQSPFDLEFYRRFARNAFEGEGALEPLRPLAAPPRIHIRTVDESGADIDEGTLNLVEAALKDSGAAWSGGRLPVQVIERGPESRVGQEGWITVRWPARASADTCGRATIGTRTGFIELEYRNPDCYCGSNDRIAPRTVRHELGHVYGYWHTGENRDVMSGIRWPARLCNQPPSTRETTHAKYMYSRTAGNLDPDEDPVGGEVLAARPAIVIED